MSSSQLPCSADIASVAEKLLGSAALGLIFGFCFWMGWSAGIGFAALIPAIWWTEGDAR